MRRGSIVWYQTIYPSLLGWSPSPNRLFFSFPSALSNAEVMSCQKTVFSSANLWIKGFNCLTFVFRVPDLGNTDRSSILVDDILASNCFNISCTPFAMSSTVLSLRLLVPIIHSNNS